MNASRGPTRAPGCRAPDAAEPPRPSTHCAALLAGGKLTWRSRRGGRHILTTLIDERVPAEAAALPARRSGTNVGGRWTAYLTVAVRLLANLAQLGSDFAALFEALRRGGGGSPALLVDALLLAEAAALATCAPSPPGEPAWSDSDGAAEAPGEEAAAPGDVGGEEEEGGDDSLGLAPLDLLAQVAAPEPTCA